MASLTSTFPAPATARLFEPVDQLLRDRPSILRRLRAGDRLTELARSLVVTIAVASAAFGAAVGAYRGGVQILYAALKLPLVILLTAGIAAPALTALNAALGRRADLVRDLALVLAALALGSLTLVAMAPLLLLAASLGCSYHATVMLLFGCCALAGIVGMGFFLRGLMGAERQSLALVAAGVLGVMALVGAQMAWTLRPYVVRPQTAGIPFVRALEGSLVEAVATSWDSARGIYRDAPALRSDDPPPEALP